MMGLNQVKCSRDEKEAFYGSISRSVLPLIKALLLILFPIAIQGQDTYHYQPDRSYTGQTLWDIEHVPETKMDIGLWALLVAKEYDPKVNVQNYLKRLEQMALEIKKMIHRRKGDMVTFLMSRMYIYQKGIWNDSLAFVYNLDDPFGKVLKTKFLNHYMDSKLGNCVSMPTLFWSLLERVDPNLPVYGVLAPYHLFLRFKDRQSGDLWNVETTNGGTSMRNAWVISSMGISEKALASGIYLQNLSKKAFIAELINDLASHSHRQENYKRSYEYIQLALKLHPNSINFIVQQIGLNYENARYIENSKLYQKFNNPDFRDIIEEDIKKVSYFKKKARIFLDKAKALGWQPQTEARLRDYARFIKQEKQKRKQ